MTRFLISSYDSLILPPFVLRSEAGMHGTAAHPGSRSVELRAHTRSKNSVECSWTTSSSTRSAPRNFCVLRTSYAG